MLQFSKYRKLKEKKSFAGINTLEILVYFSNEM